MDDYIRRQGLLKDIEKYHVSDGKFQHWVEVQPSAPVRVKRGRWILSRGDSLNFIKCTNCQGLSAEPVAHTVYPWNYCPYCGADMREE